MQFDPTITPAAPINWKTPEGKMTLTLTQVQTLLSGQTVLANYNRIRQLIYKNEFGLTSDLIYAAIGADWALKLKKMAIVTKALLNIAQPGAITDDVPDIAPQINAMLDTALAS